MILEVGISTRSSQSRTTVLEALAELAPPDQAFGVKLEKHSDSDFVLSGDNEDHLASLIARLKEEIGVQIDVGAPQVVYRETLSRQVLIKHTHRKQTGGSGQFASVSINFEPLPPGSGFVFKHKVSVGSVPQEFIPSVEKGLKAEKESGLLAGFPVTDFKATLTGGDYHDVDSNALSFEVAARAAFRELAGKGVVMLLEPIMRVEVVTPEDLIGTIIGDLNSRRGQVQGADSRGNTQIVTAMVPLADMFGYTNTLRSISQGRAQCSLQFDHYEHVLPPNDDDSFPPAIGMRA